MSLKKEEEAARVSDIEKILKGYDKKKGSNKEWRILALHLQILNLTPFKIGRILKKDHRTINKFLKSDDATLLRRSIFGVSSIDSIKEELRSLWPLALHAVKSLLESDDPNLIVQKANKGMELLVALGAKEADKQEVTHKHIIEAAREAITLAAEEAQKLEEQEVITIGNA